MKVGDVCYLDYVRLAAHEWRPANDPAYRRFVIARLLTDSHGYRWAEIFGITQSSPAAFWVLSDRLTPIKKGSSE